MILYINGSFLRQKITGVQRFAIETIRAMDRLVPAGEMEVLSPPDPVQDLKLRNIRIRVIGGRNKLIWTQVTLPSYVKKHGGRLLTMTGMCPVMMPGYLVLFDVGFLRYPEAFSPMYRLGYRIDYALTLKKCRKIFTISNFSKSEIIKFYGIDPEKIQVVYTASDHILQDENFAETGCAEGEDRPENDFDSGNRWALTGGEYYLSVGSRNLYKNQKFIRELAGKWPQKTFVITGASDSASFHNIEEEAVPNLIFTGYVKENELRELYRNAAGFILPSLYEGFGMPPLEAVMMGVRRIAVSDIPVLCEVYDRGMYHFDPCHPEKFDMEAFEQCRLSEEDRQYYLEKYSWKKTAGAICSGIKNAEGKEK